MTDNAWVKPGAKVVIINTGGWHSRIVGETTITKVGQRDIVTKDGKRYRVSDLHEQGRDKYYGDQIVDPKASVVKEIRSDLRERERLGCARRAVESWEHDRTEENTLEAITALVELLPRSRRKGALKDALKEDHNG